MSDLDLHCTEQSESNGPVNTMSGDERQNRTLSYLPRSARNGVELAEIPHSGHFPMYSNPPAMWHRITNFVTRAEE
jgi:pimeloyl-ACP methyl ester carboxylesterase